MRLLHNKAINQWLRIMFRICTSLCYTPMHAIPYDLLLDVDDAQLLPAKYFGIDLLFSSFGPCPSG
jgi:hypothetical protein